MSLSNTEHFVSSVELMLLREASEPAAGSNSPSIGPDAPFFDTPEAHQLRG